jgi:hypothetical protein
MPMSNTTTGAVRSVHMLRGYANHYSSLHRELARVLFERAQDGYVNPTGGETTGRERKDA